MTNQYSEVSVPIRGFDMYDVTNFGRVFNVARDREMLLSPTQAGDLTVGLVRDGVQYRRSVKVLVADEFVDGKTVLFNTPIHIDGVKTNLHFENLAWRPRWFAWQYTRQFSHIEPFFRFGPILELTTNREYESIWEAAISNASLCKHIYASLMTGERVFPGGQYYVYI